MSDDPRDSTRRAALRAVVAAVRDAEPHLAYEELEAYVDARLDAGQRSMVDRHVATCRLCARELAEMQRFAGPLAQPLPAERPAAPRGTIEALRKWLAMPTLGRAVGALVVIGIASVLYLQPPNGPANLPESIDTDALLALRSDALDRSRTAGTRELDQSAFHALADDSIAAAFRAGDYVTIAAALEPRARSGEPAAEAALALLYLSGQGVARNPEEALRLLNAAASHGDATAAHNLGVIYGTGALGTKDNEAAARWMERARQGGR